MSHCNVLSRMRHFLSSPLVLPSCLAPEFKPLGSDRGVRNDSELPCKKPTGRLIEAEARKASSFRPEYFSVGPLACWPVGLLACWPVGLLACWPVGLLACWPVGKRGEVEIPSRPSLTRAFRPGLSEGLNIFSSVYRL